MQSHLALFEEVGKKVKGEHEWQSKARIIKKHHSYLHEISRFQHSIAQLAEKLGPQIEKEREKCGETPVFSVYLTLHMMSTIAGSISEDFYDFRYAIDLTICGRKKIASGLPEFLCSQKSNAQLIYPDEVVEAVRARSVQDALARYTEHVRGIHFALDAILSKAQTLRTLPKKEST